MTRSRRRLENAADEDDILNFTEEYDDDRDIEWYHLDRYIDRTSLLYDIIEGFLYVADAFFILWITWGCLVHYGICTRDRLFRRRRFRRIRDGRGVFAPVYDFDTMHDDEDDDMSRESIESRESMEYGNPPEKGEFGEVDEREEAKKLLKAADEYFEKKKKTSEKARTVVAEDDGLLLDLEMTERPRAIADPDVVFL
eukprot:CAMPEP_0194216974 /NCGR_PEP_ID=MMETSP0156-20130528/20106_1 /TAXON_ID=33649 /ORGANISM="Thalassionema nitzschioides, Strain L26-B" /LENGTH=196 /DNA_ID=CAMNT_0038945873 /DNA_START=132 /DNA_END=722 /DNA_ORIENTATION=+